MDIYGCVNVLPILNDINHKIDILLGLLICTEIAVVMSFLFILLIYKSIKED